VEVGRGKRIDTLEEEKWEREVLEEVEQRSDRPNTQPRLLPQSPPPLLLPQSTDARFLVDQDDRPEIRGKGGGMG
jgi:hypothetical protein